MSKYERRARPTRLERGGHVGPCLAPGPAGALACSLTPGYLILAQYARRKPSGNEAARAPRGPRRGRQRLPHKFLKIPNI